MPHKKIVAILRNDMIESVLSTLKTLRVNGATVERVHGYGEYINHFDESNLQSCTRLEIIVESDEAESIAKIIMHAAYTGLTGDGIVAIEPVDQLFRVRELKPITT